ncbi:hypothetical protein LCGC14_2594930, partial [marine sediment metagenome]
MPSAGRPERPNIDQWAVGWDAGRNLQSVRNSVIIQWT